MIGVAVKVTLVPAHIAPEGFAAMLTDGISDEVTVIVTEAVAVTGLAQVALDVRIQVTVFPLTRLPFE